MSSSPESPNNLCRFSDPLVTPNIPDKASYYQTYALSEQVFSDYDEGHLMLRMLLSLADVNAERGGR